MGFIAPFIPYIIQGGAALYGYFASKKAQSDAEKLSPTEQSSVGGVTQAANNLAGQGQQLTQTGMPGVTNSMNYWSTLLHGNRAQMSQATAAPRAALVDQERGAERKLEHAGVQGGVRDLVKGELGRDYAGQTARLTTGMQPAAAEMLGDMGSRLVGGGTQAFGNAGNMWGSLMRPAMENRMYARQEGQEAGQTYGKLIFDILSGVYGQYGGKSGGNIPGRSTVPNTGSFPSQANPWMEGR